MDKDFSVSIRSNDYHKEFLYRLRLGHLGLGKMIQLRDFAYFVVNISANYKEVISSLNEFLASIGDDCRIDFSEGVSATILIVPTNSITFKILYPLTDSFKYLQFQKNRATIDG